MFGARSAKSDITGQPGNRVLQTFLSVSAGELIRSREKPDKKGQPDRKQTRMKKSRNVNISTRYTVLQYIIRLNWLRQSASR